MYITGYRAGVKTIDAINAVRKHTGKSLLDSKRLIEAAVDGKSVQLPDDFVLREDLEDLGFKLN
jgi:ribosomal protein L7/L12